MTLGSLNLSAVESTLSDIDQEQTLSYWNLTLERRFLMMNP